MNIKQTDSIRQLNVGQFRRPVDGKKPYAHANGNKLKSESDKKQSAVYVDNQKVDSFEKGFKSDAPKLFDSDAGLKISITKLTATKKEEKHDLQYDKKGKTQITTTNSKGGNKMAINQINSGNIKAQNMYQQVQSKSLEGADKVERKNNDQPRSEEVKTATNGEDRVEISKEAQALAQQHYEEQENNVETSSDPNQAQAEATDISVRV